jgi:regulator of sigma E protease
LFFTIIIFIITLLVLVVIHELGHFLVAKKFGIKVEEFGFGIPPRAWGKQVGETLVSINWLPFGGFVRLLGEDETDKKILENKRSFASQTVGKRILVVLAGVFMNLILAWILFYITLGFRGFQAEYPLLIDHHFWAVSQTNQSQVLVSAIAKNSPAANSGITPNDQIIALNGHNLTGAADLISQTKNQAGKEVSLTVKNINTNEQRSVQLTPRINPPAGQGALGIVLAEVTVAKLNYNTPTEKLLAGPIHSVNVVVYSGKIIGTLIGQSFKTRTLGPVSETLSGPVGITQVVNTILTQEKNPLLPYLDFVALLSLNLAIMNVLPFPALDGGRLFFLYIEAITRKKVNANVEKWIHAVGMAILLMLMLLVTFSDIHKLFS